LNDKKKISLLQLLITAPLRKKRQNKYAEASIVQAARIEYFELKDYATAEKYFEQLKSIAESAEK